VTQGVGSWVPSAVGEMSVMAALSEASVPRYVGAAFVFQSGTDKECCPDRSGSGQR